MSRIHLLAEDILSEGYISEADRYQAEYLARLEEAVEAQMAEGLQHGWAKFKAIVKKLLPDLMGNAGHKHQRFLVGLGEKPGGQTAEVDHSLDAAPRAPVQPGDKIHVRGLVEPNPGYASVPVIHFTHKSREGQPAGFIFSPEKHWTVQ